MLVVTNIIFYGVIDVDLNDTIKMQYSNIVCEEQIETKCSLNEVSIRMGH